MSQSNGTRVWVSDLDRWVGTNFDITNEDDQEPLECELDPLEQFESNKIGGLQLLAGSFISEGQLSQESISYSEWRHALHQSEMIIGFRSSNVYPHADNCIDNPINRFLKGMLDIGRRYAVARYARREKLDFPSALTATLPHGIRALINQLLASEGIARNSEVEAIIRSVLKPPENGDMIAYRRSGMLQMALHKIANETSNHPGGAKLDRSRMRDILSLARLYFSTVELRLISIENLRLLFNNYEIERKIARRQSLRITTNGRYINSWSLRHIHPLVNYYPYSVRHGLERALNHRLPYFDRTALVNELALAHCGILRMRANGHARVASLRSSQPQANVTENKFIRRSSASAQCKKMGSPWDIAES